MSKGVRHQLTRLASLAGDLLIDKICEAVSAAHKSHLTLVHLQTHVEKLSRYYDSQLSGKPKECSTSMTTRLMQSIRLALLAKNTTSIQFKLLCVRFFNTLKSRLN